MKTIKKIGLIVLIVCLALMLPNITRAAVTSTRDVYSNNGSMKFTFSGLTLDTTHEYEFGLGTTAAATIEDWYAITDYTTSSATVDLNYTTKTIANVMNASDTIYVTIRDKADNSIVLQPESVNIKMPYLQLTNYTVIENGKVFGSSETETVNILMRKTFSSGAYYQYQKVTNTDLINKYKELKGQTNPDYTKLEEYITESEPTSGWTEWDYWNYGYGRPQRTIAAPGEGLYYLWIQFSTTDVKTLYGIILVDNLDNTTPLSPSALFESFDDIDAKIERDNYNRAQLNIKNITFADPKASYYVYLSSTNSKPTVSSSEELTEENGFFLIKDQFTALVNNETSISKSIADRVERSGDIYMFIVRNTPDTSEYRPGIDVCSNAIKLEKPEVPLYVDAFSPSSHLRDGTTQIITNYIHETSNKRKMQIKIGKITDTAILLKIKNQDSTGFSDLLAYAKKTNGIYDKTVDTREDYYAIAYVSYGDDTEERIDLKKKLEDDAYYFLYVKTLDENGKWISNESVTLAQADVFGASQDDAWFLFFYGEDSFKWADFKDPTVAPTSIPQTGQTVIVAIAVVSVVGLGVYTYRRLKSYRDVI